MSPTFKSFLFGFVGSILAGLTVYQITKNRTQTLTAQSVPGTVVIKARGVNRKEE